MNEFSQNRLSAKELVARTRTDFVEVAIYAIFILMSTIALGFMFRIGLALTGTYP